MSSFIPVVSVGVSFELVGVLNRGLLSVGLELDWGLLLDCGLLELAGLLLDCGLLELCTGLDELDGAGEDCGFCSDLLEELLELLPLDELELFTLEELLLSLEELLLSTEADPEATADDDSTTDELSTDELLSELSGVSLLSVQAANVAEINADNTTIAKYFFIITT